MKCSKTSDMEERPFTERLREVAKEEVNSKDRIRSVVLFIRLCADEIDSLRQEITELKQQLKKIQK